MKKVLITGGAKGIGRVIAIELIKRDYSVLINYNTSEEEALTIKREFSNLNKKVEIFKADVSNPKEVENMITYCLEKFGTIDVLINNAGISDIKLFTDITYENWNNMINVNLNSAFYTCKNVVPIMINKKSGVIINISSIWGVTGGACEVHYSSAKAGINGFTKALAKELGPSNIRVNAIAPGFINTEMNVELVESDIEEIIINTPLRKVGQPIDIFKCVDWLIQDEFTTGQIISINGGWQCM